MRNFKLRPVRCVNNFFPGTHIAIVTDKETHFSKGTIFNQPCTAKCSEFRTFSSVGLRGRYATEP